MSATPNSNVIYTRCPIIIGSKADKLKVRSAEAMYTPSIPRITWPATIFAISRTARVINRTTTLTISMRMRNGIKGVGAPVGTKEASQDLGA